MASSQPTSFPEGPRHGLVTPDNHGDIILILSWFFMVVMILSTFLRLLIRFTTTHVPGADDAVVSLATLTGIGSTIAISLSVNNGLGRRISGLVRPQILSLEKDVYVTTILYLLTLSLTKTSTLLLITRLVGVKLHSFLIRSVGLVVLLWTVGSVFAVAFQCGVPRPWDYLGGKCFNSILFWDIIGTVDILIDFALIVLPTMIVWNLHMKWQRKLIVVSAFAFRITVIAAAITRLVFLRRLHRSSDATYDSLAYSITTQCQTTLSVVVACIPALKPYMDRAQSGFLTVSLEQRAAGGTYGYGNSYHMQSMKSNGPSSKSNTSQNGNTSTSRTKTDGRRLFRPDRTDHSAVISTGKDNQDDANRDDRSSEDGAGSEKHIIQKTQAWDISYENDNQQQQPQQHTQYPYPPEQVSRDHASPDIVHAVSSL